ncbi:hypothetical protein MCOR27_005699 [Pyricularia oryzae]|uniref:Enterotoxin n=2 Tax=Pyricularia TaxID=48558 RepID=A0ABQ8NUC9_PYRGI|nr:hypothetical protein MCOR01_002031 [Pyricularia oryzae]KAI6302247.1 hypothetical protein MCOR33_002429 [Pyricularia grisea]KAH9429387.1 hypothetical protein MCOR02_010792 [Pyricularia oryzae]KAI6263827.1 hypothetical protein MCOR19_000158 [Pyricularia oryzae]KAI6264398.1 hypothetical protein MCOR26_011370 [Pyricularia oryzae]
MLRPTFILSSAFAFPLLINTAASLPDILYRADSRDPGTIQRYGGFMSLGASLGHGEDYSITPLDHVTMDPTIYGHDRDPWISTTANFDYALEHVRRRALGRTWYIYHIKTAGLYKIIDMADEYRKVGGSYVWGSEQEYAVAHRIPWDYVKGWDTIEPHQNWHARSKPKATRFRSYESDEEHGSGDAES